MDRYLLRLKSYLLLLLIHMTLLIHTYNTFDTFDTYNYFELNYFSYYVFPRRKAKFMEGGCHIFLIYLVDCFFLIWYTQYITWYIPYIISNANFTSWKTWYNDCKSVIPGILHKKNRLTKKYFRKLPVFMLHHRNFSIHECHNRPG